MAAMALRPSFPVRGRLTAFGGCPIPTHTDGCRSRPGDFAMRNRADPQVIQKTEAIESTPSERRRHAISAGGQIRLAEPQQHCDRNQERAGGAVRPVLPKTVATVDETRRPIRAGLAGSVTPRGPERTPSRVGEAENVRAECRGAGDGIASGAGGPAAARRPGFLGQE